MVASQVVRHFFGEQERQTKTYIRKAIKQHYPEETRQFMAGYGLKSFNEPESRGNSVTQTAEVILIHGLDEPGKVWMNLAPELVNKGFSVWIMTYPNDQPIAESAQFFLKHLRLHNASGKKNVSIVAHSMGGLVAREMLTNPELDYAGKEKTGEFPQVEQLIMVGTPNHGSELARFRAFTELRDQLAGLSSENYHWLQGIFDGAGEAGIDLIPGSLFLERLNSRPHPRNVSMIVIAGVMSAMQRNQIELFARSLEIKLQGNARLAVEKMGTVLSSASDNLGDGLVPVDSARLSGVPLRIVQGTHLSVIRNISADSQRIPPALPIIIEQLNQSGHHKNY